MKPQNKELPLQEQQIVSKGDDQSIKGLINIIAKLSNEPLTRHNLSKLTGASSGIIALANLYKETEE